MSYITTNKKTAPACRVFTPLPAATLRIMSESPLRVGLMSAANIATKNFVAASLAEGCEFVAVASRSLEKAQAWASERGVAKAYGSYDELLADPDIDAVYVPMPTGLRKDWVIKAARAKKHVMCEKPVSGNLIDTEEMVAACRAEGVMFMDGVMFMHSPRLPRLKEELSSPGFGELRRVVSDFSFGGDDNFHGTGSGVGNIRTDAALEPLGALGDLGWYNTRFSLWAFDYEMPTTASAVVNKAYDNGVPMDMSVTLRWPGGRSAIFTNSFRAAFRQQATLVGSAGDVQVDDFVLSGTAPGSCSYKLTTGSGLTAGDMCCVKTEEVKTVTHPRDVNQETYMWECFARLAREGEAAGAEPSRWWGDVAMMTQAVMDACMASAALDGAAAPVQAVAFS